MQEHSDKAETETQNTAHSSSSSLNATTRVAMGSVLWIAIVEERYIPDISTLKTRDGCEISARLQTDMRVVNLVISNR